VRPADFDAELPFDLERDEFNTPRRTVPSVVARDTRDQSGQEFHDLRAPWQAVVSATPLGQSFDASITKARNRRVHVRGGVSRRTRDSAA
jgi:hypothetical protein